jgi:hypothetical protein
LLLFNPSLGLAELDAERTAGLAEVDARSGRWAELALLSLYFFYYLESTLQLSWSRISLLCSLHSSTSS